MGAGKLTELMGEYPRGAMVSEVLASDNGNVFGSAVSLLATARNHPNFHVYPPGATAELVFFHARRHV